MNPDLLLIEAIQQGSEEALTMLYQKRWRIVFHAILRIVRDFETAEETAQDVFLQVWKNAKSYDPARGTALAWIMKIASSRALDRLRRNRNERLMTELSAETAAAAPSPENLYVLNVQKRAVERAITSLPTINREALQMAFYDGYTHSEIATVSGLPLGTVKTRVRRGLGLAAKSLAA